VVEPAAVGLAIIGIIVAEFFTAISGLGGMIVDADHRDCDRRRRAHRIGDVAGTAAVAGGSSSRSDFEADLSAIVPRRSKHIAVAERPGYVS
jgi:hypothetical protein